MLDHQKERIVDVANGDVAAVFGDGADCLVEPARELRAGSGGGGGRWDDQGVAPCEFPDVGNVLTVMSSGGGGLHNLFSH